MKKILAILVATFFGVAGIAWAGPQVSGGGGGFVGTESTTGSAGSLKSNATTGVMQVVGPAAGSTRVMTTPDADFTALYKSGAYPDGAMLGADGTAGAVKSLGVPITMTDNTTELKYYNSSTTSWDSAAALDIATTGTLAGKLPRVDGHTGLNLSAAQVTGTVIRNTGQALADVNHTLPQAAAGYNFIGYVGTTLAATNYWRFTADSSPQDYMCLNGTCGKTYVSVDTPTMGNTVSCYTEQMSGTGLKNEADLGIGTSANTAVKNTVAVEFDIAGTGYSKAIAETAPGNDTIPQNKYGAVGFEIGVDGTIDAIEATANATGYDSAALAIAGIPAVAASHTRLGTVTAMSTEAGGFVFGTTALNAANTTVTYTDATVYTPSFGWVCISGNGTWSTD